MLELKEIQKKNGELRKFVQFAIDLYKDNPYYVPPMIDSEVEILLPGRNPAFDFCESIYFMAYRDGKPVGRIAGIINHRFNELSNRRQLRFGFIDFVDDREVSQQLLDAVSNWGKQREMTEFVGPLGFCDMDYEGALIEGFDLQATIIEIYNHAYYIEHFKAYGLMQDAVWNEYRIAIPTEVPAKHKRIAELSLQRLGLHVVRSTSAKYIVPRYGRQIFRLLNQAYAHLYNYCPLTEEQITYYINMWLPQVRLSLIRLIVDKDDNLVGFGLTCPSLSDAQQKARGRWFPFGWFYLARDMYMPSGKAAPWWLPKWLQGTDTLDLLLVAVRPDLQGFGINAAFFNDLIPEANRNGYIHCESGPELDDNHQVQNQWHYFERKVHKRRATFKKTL